MSATVVRIKWHEGTEWERRGYWEVMGYRRGTCVPQPFERVESKTARLVLGEWVKRANKEASRYGYSYPPAEEWQVYWNEASGDYYCAAP